MKYDNRRLSAIEGCVCFSICVGITEVVERVKNLSSMMLGVSTRSYKRLHSSSQPASSCSRKLTCGWERHPVCPIAGPLISLTLMSPGLCKYI